MNSRLEELISEGEIVYAIAIDRQSGAVIESGDLSRLPYTGLKKTWFDGADAARRLNEYVSGQTQPRTIAQGNVRCFIVWTDEQIYGLFSDEAGRDIFAISAKANRLSKRMGGS